ncbi:MAG: hypothetical protein RPU60_06710, partial [Candidatus Sedimenticola sp. (ex Thyasira tokunagai)]
LPAIGHFLAINSTIQATNQHDSLEIFRVSEAGVERVNLLWTVNFEVASICLYYHRQQGYFYRQKAL